MMCTNTIGPRPNNNVATSVATNTVFCNNYITYTALLKALRKS